MEPVGLAVGVVGLAGLLRSCLDAVERFDSWKNFTGESHLLAARWEAERLRLEEWSRGVGLEKGVMSPDHHEALDNPQIFAAVCTHLSIIKDLCTNADGAFTFVAGAGAAHARSARFVALRPHPRQEAHPESRRQRAKWALRDKAKCTAQVTKLEGLVQQLHNLVPDDSSKGTKPAQHGTGNDAIRRMGDTVSGSDPWSVKIERIMAQLERDLEAETQKDLHAWLLGRDVPNELYNDAVERRVEGTCDWILTRRAFHDWTSPDFPAGSAKILWVNGAPGFGKTVLCARVIQHLAATLELPTAHFFFSSDFESRADPFVAVRSWLSQLLSYPATFELVRKEWQNHSSQTATRSDVVMIFRNVVHAMRRLTFVLDGLDECTGQAWDADDATSVASFLKTIQEAVTDTTTRIMITSRDVPEIRQSITRPTSVACYDYKISPEDVKSDNALYSRSIVDRKLHNKPDGVRTGIALRLASRCNGQFLWIKMQEPSLRSGKNKKQLEAAIDTSPAGLNHLYERDWQRLLALPEQESARAISLLRWAAFALRPLTVAEITEALLIDDDCDDLPVDEMPDSIDEDYIDGEILGPCGSLVEIQNVASEPNAGSRTLRLAHFSVKEFFIQRMADGTSALAINERLRNSNESTQSNILAMKCLRYLSFKSVWLGSDEQFSHTANAFLGYAASSWCQHATVAKPHASDVIEFINTFFNDSNELWCSWRKWYDLNEHKSEEGEARGECTAASPLYYASLLCLTETVVFLIREKRCSVNETTCSGMSALAASCSKGNAEIVEILLEAGADVTIVNSEGMTPLHLASENGYVETVEILLKNGADLTTINKNGSTPLHRAADHGHIQVVKLFIEHGANFVRTNTYGWTPLNMAADSGHLEVVKLLLEKGADINLPNDDGSTPLNSASGNGHIEVVRLLLENGADVSIVDNEGWTPLCVTCENGYKEVAYLLLEKGADAATATDDGWTPLNVASQNGHIEVVKILLEKGANATVADSSGCTPLHAASRNGHLEVIKLLVKNGADVTVADSSGWTPLYEASKNGHIEAIELLLEKGANCIAAAKGGWTPLYVASKKGHTKTVKLLLEKGADIKVVNNDGQTPLYAASVNGYIEVVKLLLEARGDFAAADKDGWTPLYAASVHGHIEVVKLLLEKGANISIANKYGWTLVNATVVNGHIGVVKLLIEKGADIAVASNDGWTPILAASFNGYIEVVKLILEKGANISIANNYGWTPIYAASVNGHIEVAKLLLEKGADIAVASNDGRTPIYAASVNGYIEVVKLLLEKGADIAVASNDGWTPVNAASLLGHAEVVKLLLEQGADITIANDGGSTPLISASSNGHVEAVKLLLGHGAEINAQGGEYGSALQVACNDGNTEVVKLLIDNGADINAQGGEYGSALHAACYDGNREVVKLLLDNGADINAQDKDSRAPLTWAAMRGFDTLVKLLLATDNVEPDSRDCYRQTPLSFAARNGKGKVVGLLLSTQKVDPHSEDIFGRTPMWWAVKFGYVDIEDCLSWKDESAIPEMLRTSTRESDSDSSEEWYYSGMCDVCWLDIPEGSDFYRCDACRDGFYVCEECLSVGAHCLDEGHRLDDGRRPPKNLIIPNPPRWPSLPSSPFTSSSGSSNY